MLEIGTQAPNFILNDQNGQVHSLEDYRGKKVHHVAYVENLKPFV